MGGMASRGLSSKDQPAFTREDPVGKAQHVSELCLATLGSGGLVTIVNDDACLATSLRQGALMAIHLRGQIFLESGFFNGV